MSWAPVSLTLDTPFVACLSFPMALPESHMCLPARGPTQELLRRRSLLIFLRSLLSLRRGPVLGDDENAIRGSQHLKWVVSQKRHRVFAKDSLVLSKMVPPKPSFHNMLTQHNKPWVPNAPPVPGNACHFPGLSISPLGPREAAAGWKHILSYAVLQETNISQSTGSTKDGLGGERGTVPRCQGYECREG